MMASSDDSTIAARKRSEGTAAPRGRAYEAADGRGVSVIGRPIGVSVTGRGRGGLASAPFPPVTARGRKRADRLGGAGRAWSFVVPIGPLFHECSVPHDRGSGERAAFLLPESSRRELMRRATRYAARGGSSQIPSSSMIGRTVPGSVPVRVRSAGWMAALISAPNRRTAPDTKKYR